MAGRRAPATPGQRLWRTAEDALRLDAPDVVRSLRRQHPEPWARWERGGEPVLAPVVVPVTRDGLPAGGIGLVVALDGMRAAASFPGGQSVALVARPTNLRVPRLRWGWLCPKTGRLCDGLFLPDGADGFASRQGHRLRYQAERERPAERALRKVRKIRRRLGEERPVPLGAPPPFRPFRMRAHTYDRLLAQLREAEDHARAVCAGMVARHLAGA